MTKKTKRPTTFSISVPGGTHVVANFKFESGQDLKDEGRIDSEAVKEYDLSEPGKLRLSGLVLAPRDDRDED